MSDLPLKLQPYVDALKTKLTQLDFTPVFKTETGALSQSDRFLVKMELGRLAKRCQRPIDLRDHQKDCLLFEYQGIPHYLPAEARILFLELVETYQHQYIYAVYETIYLQYRQAKKATAFDSIQQKSEVELTLAEPIIFGQRITRLEERMHYVTAVDIESTGHFKAKTKDISASGMRIKLAPDTRLLIGDDVNIDFVDLAKKYQSSFSFVQRYTVRWQRKEGHENLAGLTLNNANTDNAFYTFLEQFIVNYRRKYRLDACATLESARNKLFEQFYFFGCQAIPLFLHFDQLKPPKIEYLCQQSSNATPLAYWQNEYRVLQLAAVFTLPRLKALLTKPEKVKSMYLYCFTYTQKGHTHHFSATAEELEQSGLRSLYCSYGGQKKSWRIYKVQLHEVCTDLAYSPLAIPKTASEEFTKGDETLSDVLQQELNKLNLFALMIDITNSQASSLYPLGQDTEQHLSKLIQFKQSKVSETQLKAVKYHFLGLRRESRYQFQTRVTAQFGQIYLTGQSQNFSIHGLQIKFSQPLTAKIGEVVHFDFPDLQLTTSEHQLKSIPYQLVAKNEAETIGSFKVKSANHVGKRFFTELVNRKQAENQSSTTATLGLEAALRNLFVHATSQSSAFIKYDKANKAECLLAVAPVGTRLNALIEKCKRQSTPILATMICERFSDRRVIADTGDFAELLVYRKTDGQLEPLVWLDRINSHEQRKTKVLALLAKNTIWVLKIQAEMAYKPDYKRIELELNYLAKYQPAAKQKLIELAESVKTSLYITDISQEVLLHYEQSLAQVNDLLLAQNQCVFDVFD